MPGSGLGLSIVRQVAERHGGSARAGHSKDGGAGPPLQQGFCLRDVADLTGGDDQPQGASERVGQHVDLGGQSASGTPQRLILGPPFPLAAC